MYIIIIILLLLVFLFKFRQYKIQWNTLFKKGLKKIDDRYGCYFITGRQGTGKNLYANMLICQQDKNLVKKIKTNIHSLKIPGFTIEYFDKLEEIYYDTEEYVIYVIDEISRKFDRNCRTNTQFYAWLNQCRKRHRIAILITQEWKEVPPWLRRPCKFMITHIPLPLISRFNLHCVMIGDGENMSFDKDEGEYVCPPIMFKIYKRNKIYADMYDTFEPINEL